MPNAAILFLASYITQLTAYCSELSNLSLYCTFWIEFRITYESKHHLVLWRSTVADSYFALAGPIETCKRVILPLVEISEGGHATSASEFGASDKAVVGHPRRYNDLFWVGGTYFAVFVINYLEIRPKLLNMIFSMRHKLNSEPHKFLDRVISLPSPVGVFDLLVMLIMLKCKKVPLDLNKRKHLNVFVNLLPHCLSCYTEF